MLEHDWGEGYVVDVSYAPGFYAELAPSLLRFAAFLGGVQGPEVEAPFTYYELGCGQGESTALLAAANPQGEFYGIDFNPTHIHNARRLAQEGEVRNVRFLEHSFAELAGKDLPEADIIALHGVWSWVSAENRQRIVEFIQRRLKAGGLAMVSYNCLPGQVQVAPLQRLLWEHALAGTGERMERVRSSIAFAARLEAAGAAYFKLSPLAKMRLSQLGSQDPRYLAHEYYNDSWTPFFHADVARDLEAAKLSYVASASVIDNFDQFVLKPELAGIAAELRDRKLAETVKDFARNHAFRKDVFTRGAPKAAAPQREAMLDGLRFALARPRGLCRLAFKTGAGEVNLREETHKPVLDALAGGPLTFRELQDAPQCAGIERARLRQALFGLVAAGSVAPALGAAGDARRAERTRAYNAAVLSRAAAAPGETRMLASPVTGNGVPLSPGHRLLMSAGSPQAGEELACAQWAAGTFRINKDGAPVHAREEAAALIRVQAQSFFSEILPFYRQLGVAP